MDEIPENLDNKGEPFIRHGQIRPDLAVHATLRKSVDQILIEGLKPGGQCAVWPDTRISDFLTEEGKSKSLKCRKEGVYFFDAVGAGAMQGLATVGFLKKGEPAVLIVDVKGLKLVQDPEIVVDPKEEEDST